MARDKNKVNKDIDNNKNSDNNKNKKEDNIVAIVEDKLPSRLIIIPVMGKPLFPGLYAPFPIPAHHADAVNKAIAENDGFLGLNLYISDTPSEKRTPSVDEIYKVGVVVKVFKKLNLPDGGLNLLINSIRRYKVIKFVTTDPVIRAEPLYIPDIDPFRNEKEAKEIKAYTRALLSDIKAISENNPLFTEEMRLTMVNVDDPGRLADFVTSMLNVERASQQEILETFDIQERLEKVHLLLQKEREISEIQQKIQGSINSKVQKQQREYFLKEQLKEIKKELGYDTDPKQRDIEKYKKTLEELKVIDEVKERMEQEIEKISTIDTHSPEYTVSKNYLDTLFALPWNKENKEREDISKSKKILDRYHYGLEDVKERIYEFLAVRKLNPEKKSSILCFVGPPGVGKTSIGKSIAEALDRPFFRFSLGGMRDEAEIKGHRRTYIGAMPGKIIEALKIVKVKNPVLMLDEIDKLGTSFQGDPSSALLEVLDPEQNASFRDHYLDLPFDLSNVLFITTANTLDTIPRPLLDRMEVIRLSGYIMEEKLKIASKYIIPRQVKAHGLDIKNINFTNKAISAIIDGYAREAGVRNFERRIERICRKIAADIVEHNKKTYSYIVDEKDLEKYLKKPIFTEDFTEKDLKPGNSIGLAWTSLGGATLTIESIKVSEKKDSGNIQVTGQLGDVMSESVEIAYSYVKSVAKDYGVPENYFNDAMIHLHIPEGATPKDGPSAGITMATALLSLSMNKVIRNDTAMTGELSLNGKVLPIGGLKEKTIAAKRLGFIKHIIIPHENIRDLDEIPENVKKGLTFHPVKDVKEVFDFMFKLNKLNKANKSENKKSSKKTNKKSK
ncbi:endopeptidase La [Brachyspira hyodysenteriae]|uniref:endopeptidase La n=1 Tax=Brachyspira hyodysenteriae TaxID=159 RepID=UPI0022CDA4D3|nr:endopeptidase La [Brachyspira hyodysenteriae]MCZ9850351.1 endopeptidase La [Brachyspira hyodysenteriae]MCZ9860896.1 endopeptidase La [Brachyspira hyodysenteriae]MCZ9894880.1 endopeptidase La [Brachyspira hyodysenteriae]MCZ9917468.1 endopeptidase La [Brachyspira hyodysenteriae]MCZ9922186.1 endopeptidase La [Brachyspira hyodysenteriae]